MAQIIKAYDDAKKAQAAVSDLKANNFTNAQFISSRDGSNLVSVDPPFGGGAQAEAILERHGPTGNFVLNGARRPAPVDHTTALGRMIPELTKNQSGSANLINDPAPFSRFLGLPLLSKGKR